ncbi:hypothetical protein Goshw_010060, partial [Gossypium schwendimanii]|nr:hypothetical protein [Gossypium schwendimanii]
MLDDHHKIDLWQLHMDWPRFWSYYIQIWEDQYNYIPTREPIIVPELVCVPEYMSWFRIYGKPYLLSVEERQQQLHIQRERRRRPITRPSNSTHTVTGPNTSTDDTHNTAFSDDAKLESIARFISISIMPSGPPMYRPPSHEGSHERPLGSSSFYQSPSPYRFQTALSLVMQTPPQSLFYQGDS